jgi:hypothetical protein
VGFRIGRVFKLLKDQGILNSFMKLLSLVQGRLHPSAPGGQDQFRPKKLEEFSPFHTHGIGHGQDEFVSPLSTDIGKGYPCIPTGRFNQSCSGLQLTALFSGLYHILSNPVLHTSQGIEKLHGFIRFPYLFCQIIQADLFKGFFNGQTHLIPYIPGYALS